MSTFGIVYCNACVAAPITFAFALLTGEFDKLAGFKYLTSPDFLFGFCVCSAMGLLITYSSMLSVTYNSPLATSITGNTKDVLTTMIGWIIFPGFIATFKSVAGVSLALLGGILYSYVGLSKEWAKQPSAPSPVAQVTVVEDAKGAMGGNEVKTAKTG